MKIGGVAVGAVIMLLAALLTAGMAGKSARLRTAMEAAAASADRMSVLCCGGAEQTDSPTLADSPFSVEFVPQEPVYVERFRDYQGETAEFVPVMMYHFFYDADFEVPDPRKGNNNHSIQSVREQLQFLWENGYVTLSMDELYEWLNGNIEVPKRSVVLTSDDGKDDFFVQLQPELHKYGFIATSFVITSYRDNIPYKLTLPNIELHSHTHNMHRGEVADGGIPDNRGMMQGVSVAEGVADIRKSVDILNGSQYFAYPYGTFGGNAKEILRQCGIRLAFTTQGGVVRRGDDPLQLRRTRISGSMSVYQFKRSLRFEQVS